MNKIVLKTENDWRNSDKTHTSIAVLTRSNSRLKVAKGGFSCTNLDGKQQVPADSERTKSQEGNVDNTKITNHTDLWNALQIFGGSNSNVVHRHSRSSNGKYILRIAARVLKCIFRRGKKATTAIELTNITRNAFRRNLHLGNNTNVTYVYRYITLYMKIIILMYIHTFYSFSTVLFVSVYDDNF